MSLEKPSKRPLFVVNWKMYKNYRETCSWIDDNQAELTQLAAQASLIICPTFPALSPISEKCTPLNISVGGQDCSSHSSGAFTGEVSAETLYQVGCTYCIIGHAERRRNCNETNESIAKKAAILLAHEITPIICIGEQVSHESENSLFQELEEQLNALRSINDQRFVNQHLFIAYEPAWAIGSQKTPQPKQLAIIFNRLRSHCREHFPSFHCTFLYGGSVSMHNIAAFAMIDEIDGFLASSATLDFQNFKNIVLSSNIGAS